MRNLSIRTLLLVIISIMNVLIAAPVGYTTYKSFTHYYQAKEIQKVSKINLHLYNAKKYLMQERAASTSLLSVPVSSATPLKTEITESRRGMDDAFKTAFLALAQNKDEKTRLALEQVRKSYANLENLRSELDKAFEKPHNSLKSNLPDKIFTQITLCIEDIDKLIEDHFHTVAFFSPDITRHMRVTRLIWEISEYANRQYTIIGRLIAENRFPDEQTREELSDLRGRIKYGLQLAHGSISISAWKDKLYPPLQEAETHYFMVFEQIKDILGQPKMGTSAIYPVSVEMWLQLASEAVSSLYSMTDTVLAINTFAVEEIERNARNAILISVFLLLSAFTLSLYTWWLIIARVIKPVNSMVEALYRETRLPYQHMSENAYLDEISKLGQVLKVFQDNSRQLQNERDKAQAANNAKSEFLANMSHEIRTPMNVVVGLTEILARSQPLSAKQEEFIKTLQISAKSLLALINDLLDFSKIETHSFELEKIPFNFENLVKEIITVKSFKAKEKGLIFETSVESLQGKSFIGDPTRIQQILTNLLGNAIKFTQKGSIALKIHITPIQNSAYQDIHIYVSDTGIGIPHDKINSVFEKFTQADNSVVRKYGGTGLGLTITKSLVDMMNGHINVESSLGRGSVFMVRIPLEEFYHQRTLKISTKSSENSTNLKERILLVEDYKPNIIVAGTFLEDFGYSYDIAENGLQAVQQYMEYRHDIILMDVQMPEMDGYQATRAIRQYEREMKLKPARIIGLTAHASTQDREKCINAGMDDYLSKPFEKKKLESKLMPPNAA